MKPKPDSNSGPNLSPITELSNSKKPGTQQRSRLASSKTAATATLPVPNTPSRRKRKLTEPSTLTPRTPKHAKNVDERDLWETGVVRNADKSARRKGARFMLERAIRGDLSDDDDDGGVENLLAKKIYAQGEEIDDDVDDDVDDDDDGDVGDDVEDAGDMEDVGDGLLAEPEVPAPTRQKRKQTKTYVPPPLEGYESYFEQHRPGTKTSNNTLANLPQLDLEEYHRQLREYDSELPHAAERAMLMDVHRENFGQWAFELSQGFNVILYGYGSKRQLLMEFASKVWSPTNRIVVVNGYVSTLTTRDILNTIFTAILGEDHKQKPGPNPNDMLDRLIELLDGSDDDGDDDDGNSTFPRDARITLILHSINGETLRQERHQSLLSRLAAQPRISLVTSIDHIKAPHLWDSAKISQFNFLWHDATTFTPYSSLEASVDELLYMGGSGRVGGTKGVKYVLASLPQNAKELYRILVSHQLQAMEDDCAGADVAGEQYGIEYKVFYQMAMEEFICSNDMAFRTLLKEYVFPNFLPPIPYFLHRLIRYLPCHRFQDHQMITSRRDVQGTEILWAPFRKEELESILEDIMVA